MASGSHKLSFLAAQAMGVNADLQQLRVSLLGPPTSAKSFVWSGNTIAEERDSSGLNVTKRFFAEGEQRIGGPDAGNYYYTRDHLGSVREVTNARGVLKAQYDYDAWGNQVVVTGNMSFDFGYTGHYRHAASNLYLAHYRAYDPSLGRWLSRDPMENAELKEGPNLYGYVSNNPINATDPTGRSIWTYFKCKHIRNKWYRDCFGKLPDCSTACGKTAQDAIEANITCMLDVTERSRRCLVGMLQELLEAGCETVSIGPPPGLH